MNQREHRLQAMVDRLIDRIVMQPMFVTGIDHASQTTENARARARGRGIKPGVADVFVCQGEPPKVLWMELKRGTQPTEAQLVFQRSMRACGIPSHRHARSRRPHCTDGRRLSAAWQLGQHCVGAGATIRSAGPNGRSTKSQVFYEVPRSFVTEESQAWGVARLETLP